MEKIDPKNKTVRKLRLKKQTLLRQLKNQLEFNKEMGNDGLVSILEARIKRLIREIKELS